MAQSPSLDRLADDYLRYVQSVRGYSAHTVRNYRKTVDQFCEFLHAQGRLDTVKEFTGQAVQDFVTDLATRGISRSTIVVKLSALSSLAQHLMKREDLRGRPLLDANPAKRFDWPVPEAPETEFLRPDELAAFMALDVPLWKAVVRDVLVDTGARRAELCRADVMDLVEMDGGWSIAITVKGRGTRKRKIHMPLSEPVAARVWESLVARGIESARHAETPLFVDGGGGRFSGGRLYYLVQSIAKDAGITRLAVSPHKIRHTVNVVRRTAGIDAFLRSRLLGQSNPRSQERYNHLVSGELRAAKVQQAEGFARYINQPNKD